MGEKIIEQLSPKSNSDVKLVLHSTSTNKVKHRYVLLICRLYTYHLARSCNVCYNAMALFRIVPFLDTFADVCVELRL